MHATILSSFDQKEHKYEHGDYGDVWLPGIILIYKAMNKKKLQCKLVTAYTQGFMKYEYKKKHSGKIESSTVKKKSCRTN